jgi:hypothetical protein
MTAMLQHINLKGITWLIRVSVFTELCKALWYFPISIIIVRLPPTCNEVKGACDLESAHEGVRNKSIMFKLFRFTIRYLLSILSRFKIGWLIDKSLIDKPVTNVWVTESPAIKNCSSKHFTTGPQAHQVTGNDMGKIINACIVLVLTSIHEMHMHRKFATKKGLQAYSSYKFECQCSSLPSLPELMTQFSYRHHPRLKLKASPPEYRR